MKKNCKIESLKIYTCICCTQEIQNRFKSEVITEQNLCYSIVKKKNTRLSICCNSSNISTFHQYRKKCTLLCICYKKIYWINMKIWLAPKHGFLSCDLSQLLFLELSWIWHLFLLEQSFLKHPLPFSSFWINKISQSFLFNAYHIAWILQTENRGIH